MLEAVVQILGQERNGRVCVMAIIVKLNEYSAEDVKIIRELQAMGMPDEAIQKAYDRTQKERGEE